MVPPGAREHAVALIAAAESGDDGALFDLIAGQVPDDDLALVLAYVVGIAAGYERALREVAGTSALPSIALALAADD